MPFRQSEKPVVLGYIGPRGAVRDGVDALFAGSDRYQVLPVSIEQIANGEDHVDGLVLGSDGVDGSVDALLSILETGYPLLVVGTDGASALPGRLLPHVDEFVSLAEDSGEALDAVDSLFEQRWRNLGMSTEELLEAIFQEVPLHLYVKDRQARHVRVSDYYYPEAPLTGKTDREVLQDEAFAEQTYTDDVSVIETGEPLLDQVEHNPDDGDWSLTSKVPVYDGNEIVGLLGTTHLITQRKEYEQKLERQKDRFEEFASIISHDLRNPLTVAQGRVDYVRKSHPENENLQVAQKHLRRMDVLIDDVLTMTRQGLEVEETETVDLRTVAQQCWDGVATGDATVTFDGTCQFQADQGRVRQVFENLFRNAVEHGGGDVGITVGPLTNEPECDDGDVSANDCVGFYVADDGPGIPESEREDVFSPGFTTTEEGTGLGLKIVRQVVEAHDWSITASESADSGAQFEVRGGERE